MGPNSVKAGEAQYYEGIKVRAVPLVISIQTTIPNTSPVQAATATPVNTLKPIKRQKPQHTIVQSPASLTVIADSPESIPPMSPASPILKAQLSAPPKQRETTVIASNNKGDTKSQVNIVCSFGSISCFSDCIHLRSNPDLTNF